VDSLDLAEMDFANQPKSCAERNALEQNIKEKGQNAYYYAHAKSKETVMNYGGDPPRLAASGSVSSEPKKLKSRITRYSWGDGKKTVKVYVPTKGVVEDGYVVDVDHGEKHLKICLSIEETSKDYELSFPVLHDEIKKVTWKCKDDGTLVFTLWKQTEISWYKLVGTSE